MSKCYTVQTKLANDTWLQCGNSRYMSFDDAMAVYKECSEHIDCAVFQADPLTGKFDTSAYDEVA